MMPGEDGLSLTRSLRDYHDVPIILLTALGEADQRIAGLRSGADDYLSKPFEPEELLLRIDNIFRRRGKTPTADKVVFGPYAFDMTKGILRKNGKQMKLTTGEQTLLTLLAGQSGGVVSRYILSENIKAQSERAVDVQITRLRRKIEADPKQPRYLQTVRGAGYMLAPD